MYFEVRSKNKGYLILVVKTQILSYFDEPKARNQATAKLETHDLCNTGKGRYFSGYSVSTLLLFDLLLAESENGNLEAISILHVE